MIDFQQTQKLIFGRASLKVVEYLFPLHVQGRAAGTGIAHFIFLPETKGN